MYTPYSDNSSLKRRDYKRPRLSSQPLTENNSILVLQDSFSLNHEILKGNQEDRRDHSHSYKINGKEMFIHDTKEKKTAEIGSIAARRLFHCTDQTRSFQKDGISKIWFQLQPNQINPLGLPML